MKQQALLGVLGALLSMQVMAFPQPRNVSFLGLGDGWPGNSFLIFFFTRAVLLDTHTHTQKHMDEPPATSQPHMSQNHLSRPTMLLSQEHTNN
ncbi:hypothetical protein BD289DRAFT_429367 [Coniella lustricola]|uniref:Secreted protein n=1 Tax=Coniella lustricola TaxID=2025994 RepID=A0A2T3ACU3_9PEZI|nr:hypothetical protein BD289DRAFT_429367 [Coniella lustricola]